MRSRIVSCAATVVSMALVAMCVVPALVACAGLAGCAKAPGTWVDLPVVSTNRILITSQRVAPAEQLRRTLFASKAFGRDAAHKTLTEWTRQGDPVAALLLACRLDANYPKAAPVLAKASLPRVKALAAQGDKDASLALGLATYYGIGTETNVIEATRIFRGLAEKGDPDAALLFTMFCVTTAEDDSNVFAWCAAGAAAGNEEAMWNLGAMYAAGRGTAKDPAKAAAWQEKAAENNANILNRIALSYLLDTILGKDTGKAKACYDKLAQLLKPQAEQGSSDAMKMLVKYHFEGLGSTNNRSEAVYWLKRLALEQPLAALELEAQYERKAGGLLLTNYYAQMFPMVRNLAECGNAIAMLKTGQMYAQGKGIATNETEALRWYECAVSNDSLGFVLMTIALMDGAHAAHWDQRLLEDNEKEARNGDPSAMVAAGDGYQRRKGPKDETVAKAWYDKARVAFESRAGKGDKNAMQALGDLYAAGKGVAFNADEAGRLYDLAAKTNAAGKVHGMAWNYDRLASECRQHGDEAGERKWLGKALEHRLVDAEEGSDLAMHEVAEAYADGKATAFNAEAAGMWYERAAAADPDWAESLDLSYKVLAYECKKRNDNAGEAKWLGKAVNACRTQAEQGDPEAMFQLGVAYAEGSGIAKDTQQALKWYEQSAGKSAYRARTLGFLYSIGGTVPKDPAKSVLWYQKARDSFRAAADRGDARAMCYLAEMYQEGEGVPKNIGEARTWYRRAIDAGYAHARVNLKKLEAEASAAGATNTTESMHSRPEKLAGPHRCMPLLVELRGITVMDGKPLAIIGSRSDRKERRFSVGSIISNTGPRNVKITEINAEDEYVIFEDTSGPYQWYLRGKMRIGAQESTSAPVAMETPDQTESGTAAKVPTNYEAPMGDWSRSQLYAGMVVIVVDASMTARYNLSTNAGIMVYRTQKTGPADKAGLTNCDVIVAIGDIAVADKESFNYGLNKAYVENCAAIPVSAMRKNETKQFTLQMK